MTFRPAYAQIGTVLAGPFVPGGATGNGRGISFDGTDLYYTILDDSNIYKIDTTGSFIGTISVPALDPRISAGGPLAWDGASLWTIDYRGPALIMYQVNPATGATIYSCDIAAVNPGHPALVGLNRPDGLHWTGTQLVLSGEISIIGRPTAVAFMNPDCTITSFFTSPGPLDGQWSGVAFDGATLWHADPIAGIIQQTDLAGTLSGAPFPIVGFLAEDLEFDPVTFAPLCAVWGNEAIVVEGAVNRIAAWEIPCPNQPPDCSTASPSASTLWPPNHKMKSITVTGVTDPDGDPVTITIDSIFQDEPTNGLGDGDKSPDGAGVGTSTANVRVERAGIADGRVYHIGFTGDDGNGGSCSGGVLVSVPHDQRGAAAVDQGALFDSTTP